KYRNIGGDVSIAEAIRPITYKNDLCILEAIFVSTKGGLMKKTAVLIVLAIFCLSCCGSLYAADEAKAEKARPTKITPKKVSVDTIGDGKPHRFEYYDAEGNLTKVENDTKGNGVIDETVMYENGKPVKSWKDTKGTGKPDVWVEY
ncbi:MAG: hypothetical protein WCY36_03655, partial [Candidatus Omnitrophota bacterium]